MELKTNESVDVTERAAPFREPTQFLSWWSRVSHFGFLVASSYRSSKKFDSKTNFCTVFLLFPPKSFYLHLSDCQHFCFRHSQMIWSFNLLKGLQQAVLHINHTELLLHQDLTSLSKLHMPQQKTYSPAPTHTYVSESEAPVYRKVAAYHIYCSFLWAVLGSSIKSHLHFVCLGANVLLFHEGAWCDNAAVLLWEQMRYYWGSENAKGSNWTVRQMHRLRNCPED